jgi:RNA polymerase sigma-70 factor (ECF subfamily)
MSKVEDGKIVQHLQEGNLEALGMLYDRHRNLVYRTALAITGDVDTASDLLQDVFLRLYRFADRIDSARPLEPWLYRMTTNLAYTWVKRNKRWLHSLDDLAEWLVGTGKNTPLETVEFNDDWDQVKNAVTKLPFPQRVVVVLYYLNDLPIQEIADILEVPVGTVKSRLYYGRIALKKSLGVGLFGASETHPGFNYKGT